MNIFTSTQGSRLISQVSSTNAVALGGAFLLIAGLLLVRHAMAIREVQEIGLPAAVSIPALERRLSILKEQVEVSELQQSLSEGSAVEMVEAFVLPSAPEFDRVVSLLEVLRDRLQQSGQLRFLSAVRVGAEEGVAAVAGIRALPLMVDVEMTEEGLHQFLLLMNLSGLVTVSDALHPDEIRRFLRITEEENPANVTTIEHFLSTPLLRYAREPKLFEEQVLRSFASPTFQQFFVDLLQHSALADARFLLQGPLGEVLAQERLWPTRFLTVDRATLEPREDGWITVGMEVRAYARQP